MALYCPGLGYYAKETTRIGRAGDFYTGSHLHPIFGAMLGRQMEELWAFMGRPDMFRVIEMGAGMGYGAKDMLDYLKRVSVIARGGDSLFEHLRYTIVELNPALRRGQEEKLLPFREKVDWVSGIGEIGTARGCFLSNELLDAFPVRLVTMEKGLREVFVGVEGEEFAEVPVACSESVREYFREFGIDLPEGYRTEVNLRVRDWIRDIGSALSEGFVLTVDYGYSAEDYYHEDRNRGTLLGYYRHQLVEDPFLNVGEQDLTAHVNFSSLKKWGEEAGLRGVGFCAQGSYLVSLGIDEVMKELHGDSPDAFETAKIKGLILPQGMGESHKVMMQYKGSGEPVLRGFMFRNRIGKL